MGLAFYGLPPRHSSSAGNTSYAIRGQIITHHFFLPTTSIHHHPALVRVATDVGGQELYQEYSDKQDRVYLLPTGREGPDIKKGVSPSFCWVGLLKVFHSWFLRMGKGSSYTHSRDGEGTNSQPGRAGGGRFLPQGLSPGLIWDVGQAREMFCSWDLLFKNGEP